LHAEQPCSPEIGAVEVGALDVGVAEVGALQVGVTEVGALEVGVQFEYAAHDVMRRQELRGVEGVYDALAICSVTGQRLGRA
jgi:hypothetical protein